MNNKEIALDFMNLVAEGKVEEAYKKHINMKGKHHNAYFPAGFANLKEGMIDSEKQFPNKIIEVNKAIAEGDMVAVHSHITMNDGGPEVATLHMFRIENNKIVEMWDVGQVLQKDSPNTDGLF